MGACAQARLVHSIFILCVQRTHSTAVYEIRLAAFFADNHMNSVAHCGGFYLRDIVEEKCRLRPACRKLPGLNREKTRITPRLSETSGAQQRKNVNYRAFRNVGYNKRRDAHCGRMFRLLWTFVDLKLPSAMNHAIHKIVSKERCQSYFISRRSPHLGISKDSELCASAHRCLHYAYARLIARVTFQLQQFLQHLVDAGGVCLAFHGLHGLAY